MAPLRLGAQGTHSIYSVLLTLLILSKDEHFFFDKVILAKKETRKTSKEGFFKYRFYWILEKQEMTGTFRCKSKKTFENFLKKKAFENLFLAFFLLL